MYTRIDGSANPDHLLWQQIDAGRSSHRQPVLLALHTGQVLVYRNGQQTNTMATLAHAEALLAQPERH